MYQIIVYGTIGMLVTLACAAIFIDWDKIGHKYFPETFKAPEDNSWEPLNIKCPSKHFEKTLGHKVFGAPIWDPKRPN